MQRTVASPSVGKHLRLLHPAERLSDRSLGALLVLGGCLPFAVGAAISTTTGTGALPSTCLFRLATGLPCPLCGGVRAFSYASSGDTKFLSYNGFWVFVALAMVVSGLLVAFTRIRIREFLRSRRHVWLYALIALFASGWIWALANRLTIAG